RWRKLGRLRRRSRWRGLRAIAQWIHSQTERSGRANAEHVSRQTFEDGMRRSRESEKSKCGFDSIRAAQSALERWCRKIAMDGRARWKDDHAFAGWRFRFSEWHRSHERVSSRRKARRDASSHASRRRWMGGLHVRMGRRGNRRDIARLEQNEN